MTDPLAGLIAQVEEVVLAAGSQPADDRQRSLRMLISMELEAGALAGADIDEQEAGRLCFLATLLAHLREHELALRVLRDGAARSADRPRRARLTGLQGVLLAETGRLGEARTALQEALVDAAGAPAVAARIQSNLATLSCRLGDPEQTRICLGNAETLGAPGAAAAFDHAGGHGGDHAFDHGSGHARDHASGHAGGHARGHARDHASEHGRDHAGDHAFDHGGDHAGDHAFDHAYARLQIALLREDAGAAADLVDAVSAATDEIIGRLPGRHPAALAAVADLAYARFRLAALTGDAAHLPRCASVLADAARLIGAVLGDGHHRTLTTRIHLAECEVQVALARQDRAEGERVLAGARGTAELASRVLGADHPQTIAAEAAAALASLAATALTRSGLAMARPASPAGAAGPIDPDGDAVPINPAGDAGQIRPGGNAGQIRPGGNAGQIRPGGNAPSAAAELATVAGDAARVLGRRHPLAVLMESGSALAGFAAAAPGDLAEPHEDRLAEAAAHAGLALGVGHSTARLLDRALLAIRRPAPAAEPTPHKATPAPLAEHTPTAEPTPHKATPAQLAEHESTAEPIPDEATPPPLAENAPTAGPVPDEATRSPLAEYESAAEPIPNEAASEPLAEQAAAAEPIPDEAASEPLAEQTAAAEPIPDEAASEPLAEQTAAADPIPDEAASEPLAEQAAAADPIPDEAASEPLAEAGGTPAAGDEAVPGPGEAPADAAVSAAARAAAEEARLAQIRERDERERIWDTLEKIREEGGMVRGVVVEAVKGGLVLDVGLRAFLPASLVEMRRVRDLQPYVGRDLEAKVLELDRARGNVVLSRRAWLEQNRSAVRTGLLAQLQPGQIRKGVVSSVVNFGAFVDLGGVDGLVSVAELAWTHHNHPSEVVDVGQQVEVEVLDVDLGRERISLSLKATQQDPWPQFARSHPIGQIVVGRVTKLLPFGAFVRVDGLEGLVHVSELADRHVASPDEVVRTGLELLVKVTDIDLQRRRISLSLKQANAEFVEGEEHFDPVTYGMANTYDAEGNYIYPEGFDPETAEWMPGFEEHREAWETQYAEAHSRWEAHGRQVRAVREGGAAPEFDGRLAALRERLSDGRREPG